MNGKWWFDQPIHWDLPWFHHRQWMYTSTHLYIYIYLFIMFIYTYIYIYSYILYVDVAKNYTVVSFAFVWQLGLGYSHFNWGRWCKLWVLWVHTLFSHKDHTKPSVASALPALSCCLNRDRDSEWNTLALEHLWGFWISSGAFGDRRWFVAKHSLGICWCCCAVVSHCLSPHRGRSFLWQFDSSLHAAGLEIQVQLVMGVKVGAPGQVSSTFQWGANFNTQRICFHELLGVTSSTWPIGS